MVSGRIWIAGAAIAYGLVGLGMSVSGCADAGAKQVRRAALREVAARIAAVDAAQQVVILDVKGEPTAFRVDDGTVYFLPGRQASFDDLREGQAVRAVYETGASPALLQWLELVVDEGPLPGAAR